MTAEEPFILIKDHTPGSSSSSHCTSRCSLELYTVVFAVEHMGVVRELYYMQMRGEPECYRSEISKEKLRAIKIISSYYLTHMQRDVPFIRFNVLLELCHMQIYLVSTQAIAT